MENCPAGLYALFADLMDYPTPALKEKAGECASALPAVNGKALGPFSRFRDFLEGAELSLVEELYTRTFDLQPVCPPYAGQYLFGQDMRRGMFMAKLRKLYRERNFPENGELPDHLGVMLRFVSKSPSIEEAREIVEFCLVPSFQKMVSKLAEGENPYGFLVNAILLALNGKEEKAA